MLKTLGRSVPRAERGYLLNSADVLPVGTMGFITSFALFATVKVGLLVGNQKRNRRYDSDGEFRGHPRMVCSNYPGYCLCLLVSYRQV